MQDVAIIIVTWNSSEFIETCLRSIPAACADRSYCIRLVDNASSDDTVARAASLLPPGSILINQSNLGFARANNVAAALIEARYMLLLNPDTVARPHSIANLISYADDHPEVGAVGPCLVNPDGSFQRSCWRRFPGLVTALINALYIWKVGWIPVSWLAEYRPTELRTERRVGHILGACMLIRMAAWQSVGPLDEQYFLGGEETDWCYRAHWKGWEIAFVPTAEVLHHGQRSLRIQPDHSLYHMYAGTWRFVYKNCTSSLQPALLKLILLLDAGVRVCLWLVRALWPRRTAQGLAMEMCKAYLRVLRDRRWSSPQATASVR